MDRDAKGPLLVFIPPDPEQARSARRVKAAAVFAIGAVLALSVWVLTPGPQATDNRRSAWLTDYASVGGPVPPTGADASGVAEQPRPAADAPAPATERQPPAAAEPPARVTTAPSPAAPPMASVRRATPERRAEPALRPTRPASPPTRREPPSPPERSAVPAPPSAPPSLPVARPAPPESAEPPVPPVPLAAELPSATTSPPQPPPPPRPSAPRQNGPSPRLEEVRAVPEPAPVTPPVPAAATPDAREPERRPDRPPERPLVRGAPPAGSPGGAAALASAAGAGPLSSASDARRVAAGPVLEPQAAPAAVPQRARAALERRLAVAVSPAVVRVGAGVRGGTGFIVDPAGYIVTSHHIANSVETVAVTLHDGRTLRGRIVARDPLANVAVLKVDAAGLPAVALGDSKALRVGEPVMAVGRGSGQGADVAMGSIRATGAATGGNLATDFPGHAERVGGPLVNARGEAVGVATGGGARYGTAVPIDRVKPILAQLRAPTGPLVTTTNPDR